MVTVPQGTQNPAYSPLSTHLLYAQSRKLRVNLGFTDYVKEPARARA